MCIPRGGGQEIPARRINSGPRPFTICWAMMVLTKRGRCQGGGVGVAVAEMK
jgi:hypothetical protein